MSKVSITRSLLDNLATSISVKSGEPIPMTLTEMKDAVDGIQTGGTLQTITKSYTPTESQQTETITAGSGYDGIEEVDVTVGAISSTYVGTGITRRSSTDLEVWDDSVVVPAGYYAQEAEASVQLTTIATPTAIKGAVSNHSVSVTPSVTQTAGYISNGTKTGTAVTVSASELVSGTYNVTSSGTKDVTDYASISVPSGSATPASSISATGATVSTGTNTLTLSKAVSNTPQVSAGYISSGTAGSSSVSLTASVNTRSSSDLTESGATVTAPAGYYGSSASKTIASGTEGTPTATKGAVSNHSISVTPSVTNTTGYITGSTKTGTAVTVSASELVSGTYTVDSSGTKDVTNYASASVPAGAVVDTWAQDYYFTQNNQRKWHIEGGPYVSAGWLATDNYSGINTDFNAVASGTTITPSTSNQTIGGANYMMEGAVTVSGDQNLSASNIKKNVSIFGVTGTYEGGGGSSMQIGNLDGAATSTSSISFTGLQGEPTAFSFMVDTAIATGTPSKIVAVVFDGTSLHAQTITNTANAQVTYDSTSLSKTYSNGTLTITSNGPSFVLDYYYGVYTYSGGAVDTKDVQVGSGATSITFTGLEDEPAWWSCIFKSNFGTSSGYQRVIYVAKGNTTTNVSGLEMDSGAHNAVHWTASYSNGSFTITSQGTNAGGYFHQPGYYQLTYAYDDGSSGNYQSKTVTPTTSQQVVEADTGYDALKKVTVNAIPSSYVQPTSTVGATTYRASTSSQTISSGTYHSAAATIAAVSQTNLSADNIKSGTTITISNGQDNLWSVTGKYTGGGTSKNVQVLQSTSRTNSSSLTKVLGDLTVSKTGTYDIYWSGGRSNTSTSYTWGTRLYVDGTGYGTENTAWTNNCQSNHLSNVSLTANQKLSVYARGRSGSYYTFAPMLVIIEA